MSFPVLSLMLVIAFAGALFSFMSKKGRDIALIFSSIDFILSLYLMFSFTYNTFSYQFMEKYGWISTPYITANYVVGADGLSIPLILLTTLLVLAVVIYSWDEKKNPSAFFGLIMLEELGVLGVFISLDFLLFFIFWEVSLIPMFFLIAYWGGPRKNYASYKFLIYTHVAGIIMLVSVIAMYFYSGATSLDFAAIASKSAYIAPFTQAVIFLGLLFGFGTKMPIVPMHTWLPDAHVEAPTAGSALLAGLLLKMGGYGLIRLAAYMLPAGRSAMTPLMMGIGILGVVWGAVAALSQTDMKKMVAYSSISHMGLVLIAIATWTQIGLMGAVFLMFAHGLVSAVLFMGVGSVHHSYGTRDIPKLGGIADRTPMLSVMLVIGSLASLGLPALISFPAEFSILYALFSVEGYIVAIPLATLTIVAGFYIWMLQRVVFGKYKSRYVNKKPHDISLYEAIGIAMLISLIVLYGVLPFILNNIILSSFIGGMV